MIVFVHGVPETAAIWRGVQSAVTQPSVALSLPGFGCPRPDGFSSTKDEYVEWIVGELAALGEPVDLVGHDWGALLVYRIATSRPDLLRSWAADIGNVAHPGYEWHNVAQMWQMPGVGEGFFDAQALTPVEDVAAGYETMGIAPADALDMASAADETMAQSILALYRSAVPNVHADWGPWSPTAVPGLVLHTADDPFSDAMFAKETADQLGAHFAVLDGVGHFWPYEAPQRGAELLEQFWSSI